jgi:hypothetical protein
MDGMVQILHQILMMGMEVVPEMSVIFNQLTQLIAQDLSTSASMKASGLRQNEGNGANWADSYWVSFAKYIVLPSFGLVNYCIICNY